MKKDKQDEAQRHAHRDAIIRAVFQQLVYHENYSYECAYIFIGDIWGLGRSKLAQIVNAKDDCPLSDKLIDDFNALTEDAQTKVADYVIDRASSSALRDELRRREGY